MIPAIVHHFGGAVYAKETHIPAGLILVQHKHKYDHLSILASGTVLLDVDGVQSELTAPQCLTIKAAKHHGVKAVTDVIWYCIHGTDVSEEAELFMHENTEDGDMIIKRLQEA